MLNDLPWGQHNNIEQNKTKILIAGTGSLEASHQTDFRERQPRRAKWRPGLLPEASDFPAKFGEKSDRVIGGQRHYQLSLSETEKSTRVWTTKGRLGDGFSI